LCAPYAWSGREAELRSLCAADAQRGLDALAQQPSVDSTALVVVGLRESAPIATLAAASDPRVKALVLVTPRPGPTELGTMRATVERLRCPVLFQTAPEEFDYDDYIETLNRSLDPQTSRIVSCQRGGSGAALYQHDDRLRAQLRDWLKEILAPRRPAARRR
jgi:pimeloyl-ACP methyl ester carboxylesterase